MCLQCRAPAPSPRAAGPSSDSRPGTGPGGLTTSPPECPTGIKLDTLQSDHCTTPQPAPPTDSPAHSCQHHPRRCLSQNPVVSLDLSPIPLICQLQKTPCAQASVHPLGRGPLTLQSPEGGGTISPVGHPGPRCLALLVGEEMLYFLLDCISGWRPPVP